MINKNKNVIILLNEIILLILIYIYLKNPLLKNDKYFPTIKTRNIIYSSKNNIIIKNDEEYPNSLIEVITNNNIDYLPKISIIISVHNNEYVLPKCLDSIVNQTLKEIEIICIDNGSIDNSLDIIKKYSRLDKRMIVIKHNLQHSGITRNFALELVKGKYLTFIDADTIYEINALENMYNKILNEKSDIVICQTQSINLDNAILDESKIKSNLNIDLISKKDYFNIYEIYKNIFQICDSHTWDKLFKTEFIKYNNIRFFNIKNINDAEFTYISLCLAKSISIINEILIIKKYTNKNYLFSYSENDINNILKALDMLKYILEAKREFKFVKKSFWEWAISLSFNKLKKSDKQSKEYFYNLFHKKLISWNYIDESSESSNRYIALNYIKFNKVLPTINILYIVNKNKFNFFLVSLISLLKNSEFENINIFLLYSEIQEMDLLKIHQLKEIRLFNLYIHHISENPNDPWYYSILINKFSFIDKLLYLDCKTIIRKTLLPIWEIDMKNKLIAGFKDFSFFKEKIKNMNIIGNILANGMVLLVNCKEWRKIKLDNTIDSYSSNNKNFVTIEDYLNLLTDIKQTKLNHEFIYMEFSNNTYQYQYENLKYKNIGPTIIYLPNINHTLHENINNVGKEYLIYSNISQTINKFHLIIPIVLYSNDDYSPYMYTTMVSILENADKKTFYVFYLLVPSNFSEITKNTILKIYDIYKCYIRFIYLEKIINNSNFKSSRFILSSYYHLLIGDLLPNELNKCLYLDVDICVCKDLAELFNIDIEENYVAGVIDINFYFSEEKKYKRLNISSMKPYINSGVIVMNLKKIRENNITQKFYELTKNNDCNSHDILNIACSGKIKILPPKFNSYIWGLKVNEPNLSQIYQKEEILEAINQPYIIHYMDKNKPWSVKGAYNENYWWNIAKKTPYINNLFNRYNIYKDNLKKYWFFMKKKKLNIDNPQTFNEKIQWLKLYDTTPIKTKLTDKYLVRGYISDRIGDEYLIPLLGVYKKFEDIDFNQLPNQFVIKCNHGSGFNIIVKNKSKLNINKVKASIDSWMKINYAFQNGLELQYKNIERRIIIEKYMDDGTGNLRDYKFTCFNGKPLFLWVDSDRFKKHKRNIYDLNWNQLPCKINDDYETFPSPKKPKLLDKMIELASNLSIGFIYVRIDLYLINEKIYFSEMTFTSSSGTEEISPIEFERKLSSSMKLPKIKYNMDTCEYYS